MAELNYSEFPFVDVNDFKLVSFDCTLADDEYYYLMFTYFKQFAEEGQDTGAQGMIFSTNIRALTLQEIDARCLLMFRAGLFDGLDISAHGRLYDDHGNEIDAICWNHIHDSVHDSDEHDDTGTIVISSTHTVQ